jgi:hypothetical protein
MATIKQLKRLVGELSNDEVLKLAEEVKEHLTRVQAQLAKPDTFTRQWAQLTMPGTQTGDLWIATSGEYPQLERDAAILRIATEFEEGWWVYDPAVQRALLMRAEREQRSLEDVRLHVIHAAVVLELGDDLRPQTKKWGRFKLREDEDLSKIAYIVPRDDLGLMSDLYWKWLRDCVYAEAKRAILGDEADERHTAHFSTLKEMEGHQATDSLSNLEWVPGVITLHQSLMELPPAKRNIALLLMGGYEPGEIADLLTITPSTVYVVRNQLKRAREKWLKDTG